MRGKRSQEPRGKGRNASARQPVRVLVLDHAADVGGAQLAILKFLEEAGGGVDAVLCCGAGGGYAPAARAQGLSVEEVPFGSIATARIAQVGLNRDTVRHLPALIALARKVNRVARHHRCGVIYTNSQKAHVIGGLIARCSGRTWIVHMHDILAPPYVRTGLRWAVSVFLATLRPALVVCNSRATEEALATRRILKTMVVYPRVNLDLRVRDRREPGAPVFGMLGRLAAWKGQHVAVEALSLVRVALPGARLRIGGDTRMGDPGYVELLERRCSELGVADAVEFVGWVNDSGAFFGGVDVAVHASTTPEPFGLVILEALAAGRPVVATLGGGADEILDACPAGFRAIPGDAESLAAAMIDAYRVSFGSDVGPTAVERAQAVQMAGDPSRLVSAVREAAGGVR